VHLVIGLLFITGLLTGCAPQLAPLDQPIDAESELDYNRWLSNGKPRLSPLESHKFERASDTINLEVGLTLRDRGSADRRTTIRQLLDGSSPRQVIAYANWIELHRLDLENAIDVKMLQVNFEPADPVRISAEKSIGQSIRGQIHAIRTRINDRKKKSQTIVSDLPVLSPSVGPEFWSPQLQNDLDLPATLVMAKCPHPQKLPTLSPR